MKVGEQIAASIRRITVVAILFIFQLSISNFLVAQCGVKVKKSDMGHYAEALAHYNSHNFRQSAALMRKVASRNPKAADPQFWLGMTAVHDGFNTTGIRRYFTKCIELCPTYPNALAHFYMGMILYTDDRYEEAVAELDKYFELANGNDDKAISAVYEEASNYLYWSQFLAEATLNMAPFDPQRVEGVSSKHNEALPYLSPDGTEFYYLRQLPEKKERTYYARELEEKHWRLCYSRRVDTTYSGGVELPAPFNSGNPEGGVSLTADGSELYYSIIVNKNGYANSDIYRVRRKDGKWGKSENLGPQINGDKTWESQPAVSADGKMLFFASNRKGGKGGIDIWRCRRLPNGDWSRPENLGAAVNTAGNEKMPFLAADGRMLYFLSDGWQGFGGYDIYFTNLADPYGNRPTNLGLPINTEGDEVSFGVTSDGRHAYFSGRTDMSRSMDILMFDLYPAARPEAMRLCRVRVNARGEAWDTVMMLSEQADNIVTFNREGMLPVVLCRKARQMPSSVTLTDSVAPLAVKFLAGSRLDSGSEQVVDALAGWLTSHPRVHLAIECPRVTEAKTIYDRLLKINHLRAERFAYRGGTDVDIPQIRLQ